jgi:hypothetical protein
MAAIAAPVEDRSAVVEAIDEKCGQNGTRLEDNDELLETNDEVVEANEEVTQENDEVRGRIDETDALFPPVLETTDTLLVVYGAVYFTAAESWSKRKGFATA